MEDPQTVPSTPVPPPPAAATAESGLTDNMAGALAYITIIPAILFLVLDQYNKRSFVRFHAFQSIGLAICWIACSFVLAIPILGWIVGILGDIALFVCWIMCIVKASKGERWKVPFIGNYAENLAK